MTRTEYQREYRKNNQEKIAKIKKDFFERHPEKQNAYIAKWRETHREQYNAYMREYYRRRKSKATSKD